MKKILSIALLKLKVSIKPAQKLEKNNLSQLKGGHNGAQEADDYSGPGMP